uniref:DNA-directed DNA polymerase n=1 Tax=Globodera pallida TaxID=36090 RepID=A0A183BUT0_GLOPA
MSPPPAKRTRRFFIEDILREPYNELSPPQKTAQDYVKKLDNEVEQASKFQWVKTKSRFSITDVPADPEGLLAGIFQHCVDGGLDESRQRGVEPTHLGCTISSQLLSSDIWIPVRQITEDTINTILNRFNDVAQSKKQDGVTLWGEPFTVSVTTVNRNGLNVRRLKGGAPRKLAPVHHRISAKSLININNNNDGNNYCLFYAMMATLMHAIGGLTSLQFFYYLHSQKGMRGKLQQDTMEMMNVVNAPPGQQSYDAEIYAPRVIDWWNTQKFVDQFKFKAFIFGSSGQYKPLFKYGPEEYEVPIILYFDDGCNKMFFNDNCRQHHLTTNFCKRSKECKDCGKVYDVYDTTRGGREGHKCHEKWCENCQIFHDLKRGCYIKPLDGNEKKEASGWRLVTFDLETMQHEPADPDFPEQRKHQVNFITAKVACPECISSGEWKKSLCGKECQICGPNRVITFSQKPFRDTDVDKQIVTRHPLVDFVKWILYELPIKFETVAYSHFGGRFDMVLVFREIFMEGLNPTMIRKGNRLFEMTVTKRKNVNPQVSFRDSWNLVPGPLASMVPMFALDVQEKPFFPHLSNQPANYGRLIHPSKADYLADGMMPEKRKQFDRCYCKNDVDILMSGLVAFRSEFLELTKRKAGPDGKAERATFKNPHNGIDPVRDCITIASACMRHFRTNHLKPGHLALVPEKGYDSCGDNQSDLALAFMDWYAEEHGVRIQNAFSADGEKRVGNFRLDGWIEEQQKGLEIHGCVWHACPRCYPDEELEMPNGKTAGRIRERNKMRMDYIKSQFPDIEIFWECDIRSMLVRDKQMKEKFDEFTGEGGPINIRGCFMGGRTGALKLYHQAASNEEISYYDFTSLYPFINFVTTYPVGHPKLDVPCEEVDWRRPEDNPYPLAILKVFVIPPRQIDVPVLPVKVNDRLCFPLCMACCKKYPSGAVMDSYSCTHNDKQRGWISTCTSLELNAALEEGYRVTDLLRVLEYSKGDNKLFRPYISEFIAQKMHASGFDEEIRGNFQAEEQFIGECLEKFDIKIDRSKMIPNKGKRSLAKLGVNNLWGRFSLRNFGLSKTLITDDPGVLGNYLDNRKIEITALDMLTPEVILISYVEKKEWIKEHPCSNVVISLFTTSAARLHLLKSMQKVVRSPGCTLLYTDTDSLVYAHPKESNPLQTGPHLGQFTNELPKHEIAEFVSGGSKQYGLKLRKKDAPPDSNYEYILKVRGMTLNHDVMNNQGKGIVCSRDFRVLDFGHIEP